MPKAFFCHASEDKPIVEAVYERVVIAAPDLSGWLDKYEILAGESLIDRIAAGMDESDKFVIFLSPISIAKPWVTRELQRAIMREIEGLDPSFIIPVLIGEPTAVPSFLEHKKYIPLYRLPENEWLPQLIAAIREEQPGQPDAATPNLVIRAGAAPGQPHIARITFEATMWPAKLAVAVATSEDIVCANDDWNLPWVVSARDVMRGRRVFGVNADSPLITPGHPVVFVLEFAPGVDAVAAIKKISHWNPK